MSMKTMSIILAEENVADSKAMRDAYAETLIDLAEKDERVVVLDADLMSSMGMKPFAKKYPERTFNVGIAEANMIGVASGLSLTGKIPFAHTFGVFASRRACDQVAISGSYQKANIRIVGSDPGITAAYNGGTHQTFEDLGIMRGIPEMTVMEPTDVTMLKDILRQVKDKYGMYYIRLVRKTSTKIYEEGSTFEIGKAVEVAEGNDATVIASGLLVAEAIKAAKILKDKGISIRVLNMFTVKPIDKEAIIKSARETGAIVTAENHNILNGLGSAVAEVLGENIPVPMVRIGMPDCYGEVGSVDYLKDKYGLNFSNIVEQVEKVIKRKNIK
ncbi:transketolase family protein [Clostridium pasteurianum]|uniref:Transketolase, alpha subunit n=1 Tax=Clostridium pasteurianum BC1 TaxID=86416 RepID=R4K890_CLOPA|nr:transketolase family protein [Clostridium pasteurianum]AGK98773.1 transketolase, alpha subunit [Clostridium pasteurianum BC1]